MMWVSIGGVIVGKSEQDKELLLTSFQMKATWPLEWGSNLDWIPLPLWWSAKGHGALAKQQSVLGEQGRTSCCLVAESCPSLLWPAWTVVCQAPLSMEFPRQEYWSGFPFPSPGDLPTQWPNLCLLLWQPVLYRWNHQGHPRRRGVSESCSFHVQLFVIP